MSPLAKTAATAGNLGATRLAAAAAARLSRAASAVGCLALPLLGAASATADDAAPGQPFRYSFEDPSEVSEWQCQPGITTELSDRWASEGKSALQINVPPGTPWFGVQREVKLDEFRRHEFLEFDLHAVTEVDYAGFKLHAEKFQELLANHDRLQPGETVRVRLRLADNDIVRFGDTAMLSIWMANNTGSNQAVLVDNIRLTGFGGDAAELDRLRARIKASHLSDPATTALLADCAAKLDGEVTAGDVAALKDRWGAILAGALDDDGAGFLTVIASPLDKIKRTGSLADLPVDPAERGVRLEMARNEYETRQLVFLPANGEGEITLEVSAGDLAGPQGAVIPAADIELRLVEEIDISGTTQFPGDKITGHWPDPLVPNAPFTIKEGRLQCVWLTVKTGATAAPGEYQGRLAIKESGGKEVSLPLTVNVWDFALPEKSSLKSLFGAWSHNWATFYNYAKIDFGAWLTPPDFDSIPKDRQLDAIRFFARYRATLQGMNTWGLMFGKVVPPVLQPDGSMSLTKAPRPDLPTYDEVAVAAMQNDGALTIAEIGGHTKLHEGAEAKDTALIARTTEYLQMVERHAEEKGWEGPLYCYMWDEPHLKPNGWSAVLKESRLVKTVAPKIKTLVASGVFSPTPKQAPFYKDIDAFVLLWDRTPQRDAQYLRKIGKEMWWYGANVTDAPYPNWAVNNNNFAVRIIPLMSYKFQMDGMLQWAATLFADANSFPQDGPRWPERPWSMKDWPYRPGEGHVVYPAPDQSFWPSIRLSNWRDGMEDYEYLKLLERALPGLPEEKQARARELLSLAALVTAPYDYSHQPADFTNLRREAAALLAGE